MSKLSDFYHNQFANVITTEHTIDEIEYYSQYGNWPIALAVWLQRRRIQWFRAVIWCLNFLPERWLKPAVSAVVDGDEIPF